MTLDSAPEREVTVPLRVVRGAGVQSGEYDGVPARVTFAGSETGKSFRVTFRQDTEDEPDETLTVGFGSLPDRVTAGTVPETVLTIEDDDHPEVTVSFGAAALAAPEGAGVEVRVTLDRAPEREVTVPLRVVPGAGVQSSDYEEVPASVTFAASETGKSFRVTFRQDTDDEPNETLTVGFGSLPDRVTAGTVRETVLTIEDDDHPEVTVSFDAAALAAPEGAGVEVRVTLDRAPEREVTVPLRVVPGAGGPVRRV